MWRHSERNDYSQYAWVADALFFATFMVAVARKWFVILPLDYGREMSGKRCDIHSCILQILGPFRVYHHDLFLVRFLQTVVFFKERNFYLVTVMRVLEIKLSRFARYKTKHACCSAAKDQWFRIDTGFVISIMWIKPVKFRVHSIGARGLVDVIWSKNSNIPERFLCLIPLFCSSWDPLSPLGTVI